jgi:ACR3 family arsenite efflux pump ArsB
MSIVFVLLLVCEIVGLATMCLVIGKDKVDNLMNNPLDKAIISVPLNLFFLLLVTLSYYLLKKKGDSDREVSS